MGKNEVDLDSLSLEELRALADGEAQPEPEVKQVEPEVEPEEQEVEEPEEVGDKFVREIDLGDGSGVQVFKAPTLEKLLDKLAEAQKNATKKIREQAAQLKKYSKQAEEEAADNEYIVGQELMSKPTAAFKKLFKETTGVDIDQFKTTWERVEAFEQAQSAQTVENRKNEAASQFLAAHPEFVTNKQNGARLERAVNLLIADAERTGRHVDFGQFLEDAFADLSQSGLLELKSAEPEQEVEPEPEPEPEPVKVVQVQAHTRRSSGLSSRVRTVTAPRSTGPSEDELYEMPLEKLRELGMRQR
jgi:hypothetical protein